MSAPFHGRVLAKAYPSPCLRRPLVASISNHYSSPSRGVGASRYFPTSPTASPSQGRRLRPSFANGLAGPYQGRGYSPAGQFFDGRPIKNTVRTNFSYAGPRKLSDILKTDLLSDKSPAEVSGSVCEFLFRHYSTSLVSIFFNMNASNIIFRISSFCIVPHKDF